MLTTCSINLTLLQSMQKEYLKRLKYCSATDMLSGTSSPQRYELVYFLQYTPRV
jgi:hypothetical protein